MTHGEKMARAALERWLKFWERQQRCSYCKAHQQQCHKHARHVEEVDRLAEQTRRLLEGGPN